MSGGGGLSVVILVSYIQKADELELTFILIRGKM